MATGVASIFRLVDSTDWDVENNHHQCVCHVIALILGAGLSALKLLKAMVRPEKNDQGFSQLETIIEEEEEPVNEDIVEITKISEDEDEQVDPDDAEPKRLEPGWEDDTDYGDVIVCKAQSGIGFTLKKVHIFISQLISNRKRWTILLIIKAAWLHMPTDCLLTPKASGVEGLGNEAWL